MWVENRSFDPLDPAKLTSIDRLQTQDLMIDQVSGEILGQGPGWLSSIRLGAADPTQPAGPPSAVNSVALATAQLPPPTGTLHDEAKHHKANHHHGAPRRAARRAASAADKNQLNYLNVRFTGAVGQSEPE